MLSKYGLYNADHKPIDRDHPESVSDLQLCLCRECLEGVNEAKVQTSFVPSPPEVSPSEATVPEPEPSSLPEVVLPGMSAGLSKSSEAGICNIESSGLGTYAGTCKPPINAIANGNWIGYLPKEFECISRTEEQAVALIILQIYLKTVIGSENKCLNSHIYLIKNSDPILRSICHDVIGTILFTLVGAHVSEQEALIRQRFPMSVDAARALLHFLDTKNVIYKAHEHNLSCDIDTVMQLENFIVDRSDNSEMKVSPKLVRMMQFNTTTYNLGTAEEVSPAAAPLPTEAVSSSPSKAPSRAESSTAGGSDPLSESSRTGTDTSSSDSDSEDAEGANEVDLDDFDENTCVRMLYQPIVTEPKPRANTIIAFNSDIIAKNKGLGSLAYAFPTRFPYGCGTYDEKRPRRMTERQWLLRTLRLHGEKGNRNSQHFGLMAAGFDHIAMMKAFRGQYVSMRVRQEAISNYGLWNKDDINECIQYKEQAEERARRGLPPQEKPRKVASLLRMIDMIKPGMAAMYGSDASRKSALHIAFGFNIRFSNPHFFYTISPDPYSNYVVSINTSNMSDPSHVDLTFAVDEVLPNRRMRKKHSNSDPFLCAVFAKAVNEAFIEYFLGWSLEFKGPKKEGGALGLVSNFHQVSIKYSVC
jgi:hypothetical protein